MRDGEFRLTPSERTELKDRLRSRTLPAEDVRRARLILLLAQGKILLGDSPGAGVQPQLYQSLEGSFRSRAAGGPVLPPSRTSGGETNSCAGGQDSGMDPQTDAGWFHALEQPQVGPTLGH